MVKQRGREASLVSRTSLSVRFSEVDSMAIVWHGVYVRYFEDGREHFGRTYDGLGYMDLHESGYQAPMVDLKLQFKKPLTINDRAIVETRHIDCEAAKICFDYTIFKEETMEVVATGSSVQVFLSPEGELELVNPEFYLKWKERWGVK